eukprot:TRINITY_DN1174_c0_g1_i1.p1 TRINITY_DN1174_c0_g1~~TRINITY_DN1174_c0_g1_i1.p1  ORF type:complete len:309 (-),score=145.91 TRINITY_DN1174_c0_g1_i1:106-963(-)
MFTTKFLIKNFKSLNNSNLFKLQRTFSTNSNLIGKTALVTGSTSGIGLAIAKALSTQGCKVMLNGLGSQQEIQSALNSVPNSQFLGADLSKRDQVYSLVEQTTKQFGSIDILVNNAGIQFVSPLDTFPDDKWDTIIAINLSAVFYACKFAMPNMKQKHWGRVINIASVHGLVASANKSAYVASKHAVVGFTKSAALEYAGTGVTINCVNPGWVLTPLVEKQIQARAEQANVTYDQAVDLLLSEKQPSKQFVKTEDLAQMVVFLCSSAADQITGISLVADGGWTSQ